MVAPANPPHEAIACPVCGGKTELVNNRFHQKALVCVDCHLGITIPSSSYEVARLKREGKWPRSR